jgi:hypothetical protein
MWPVSKRVIDDAENAAPLVLSHRNDTSRKRQTAVDRHRCDFDDSSALCVG